MRTLCLAVVFSLSCFAHPAASAPCLKVHPLLQGQTSTCDGDLLPTSVHKTLLNYRLDAKRLAPLLEREKKLRSLDAAAATEVIALKDSRIAELTAQANTPLTVTKWRGVTTWGVVGVALTFLAAGVVVGVVVTK